LEEAQKMKKKKHKTVRTEPSHAIPSSPAAYGERGVSFEDKQGPAQRSIVPVGKAVTAPCLIAS
jgi:hypothetical protein